MDKVFIGIDNGVTGSIGIVSSLFEAKFFATPVKKELDYTKTRKWLNRVDGKKLKEILEPYKYRGVVYLERPLVNPVRFRATISAIRCFEATLIVIEDLDMPREFVDSKQWQKEMLPAGLEKEELKKASLDIGRRMFPHLTLKGDADSVLMAEWARRKYS